ncbi:MAG TPA: aminotransferase class IV [Terriglobales bacterium]|nr:aminotransferase class IV [Terriglobales bacterium]
MKIRGSVWLNGRIVAAARARVSVFDRGLLYGDGLFETVRLYRGQPFALAEHLARMRASAEALAIPLPAVRWPVAIARLLGRNGLADGDGWLRITLTRGPSERGLLPSSDCRPTLLLSCGHLDPHLAVQQQRGIAAALLPFARNPLLAEHKTANYLDGIIGRVAASRRRCAEGIFIAEDGTIREATTANLFIVSKADEIVTPPPIGILRGVARSLVLGLLRQQGRPAREGAVTVDDLTHAGEVFLTSSIAEVLPVVAVNGRPIGTGHTGKQTKAIQKLYREYVNSPLSPGVLIG